MEIRTIFLYEFKRGTSASKTARNINEAFGENIVSRATAKRWFKKFKEGNYCLENEERGRPESVVDNEELKRVVESNPRQTVREIAGTLEVSKSSISRHLQQIEKVKKLDQWIPHELTENQKILRLETCSSLLLRNKIESFLDRIVTCDEKWILYDNRKRTGQWLDKNEDPKQFPKPQLTAKKIIGNCLVVF